MHWLLSKWAMWFSLLQQSTWRCLPNTHRKNLVTKGFHLRDKIQGLGEPEPKPLKLKVTSQPFCFPTSDTRSQRKKKSRLAREEVALPFHQRTKKETSKEKEEKYQSSEAPHLNSKASERKKRYRALQCEDTSTAWKAWKKLDEENLTLQCLQDSCSFPWLNQTWLPEIGFLSLHFLDCNLLFHKIWSQITQAEFKSKEVTLSYWNLV